MASKAVVAASAASLLLLSFALVSSAAAKPPGLPLDVSPLSIIRANEINGRGWISYSMITFGLGFASVSVEAMNNNGTVALTVNRGDMGSAWLLRPPYNSSDLELVSMPGTNLSEPPILGIRGINNNEDICGFIVNGPLGGLSGFYRINGEDIVPFKPPGSDSHTELLGISGDGKTAVGCYDELPIQLDGQLKSFELDIPTGKAEDLHLADGGTQVFGINNAGDMAGVYEPPNSTSSKAFLNSGGKFTAFEVPQASSSSALALNNKGDVAGFFKPTVEGTSTSGLIIKEASSPKPRFFHLEIPVNLSDYKRAKKAPDTFIYAITDDGTIAGSYKTEGALYERAFIAKPIAMK